MKARTRTHPLLLCKERMASLKSSAATVQLDMYIYVCERENSSMPRFHDYICLLRLLTLVVSNGILSHGVPLRARAKHNEH